MATSPWALAPAVPLEALPLEDTHEELRPRFNALMLETSFLDAATMRDQVGFACQFLRHPGREKRVSFGKIAAFFRISKGSVINHMDRFNSIPQPPQRPRALPDEALRYISQRIQWNFAEKAPVSYRLLLDEIQLLFGLSLRPDTLRHICRTLPGVKSVSGIPMETQRVLCAQEDIAGFYDELEAVCEGIPAAFIWNVDETGCNEWTDKQAEYRVLVPDSYDSNWTYVPLDRHSKRSTLVGCIAADGSAMRAMIIVDRVTMEADLDLFGYDEEKILIVSQENAFMTTVLFQKWADEVFFPTIEEKRKRMNYEGPALLILDGLGCHHNHEFLEECEERNIYVLFLVPHSSDQCQPLDLVTFSLLKRYFTQFAFDSLPTAQSNKIIKMMGAWYQATAPHQVISAWLSMGVVPYRGVDGQKYASVQREKARRVRGWTSQRIALGTQEPIQFEAARPEVLETQQSRRVRGSALPSFGTREGGPFGRDGQRRIRLPTS
jgi:hypothetical protein